MTISLIITTKNKANYLDLTLYGLQRQSYKNFETIIVNDGSSDETDEVVAKWSKILYPLKYIRNTSSIGAGNARNIALDKVSRDYVLFLDDDRLLDLNGVKEHVLANRDNTTSFICGNRWETYSGITQKSRDIFYSLMDKGELSRYRRHIEPMPRVMSKAYRERGHSWSLKWFLILTGNLSVPMSILEKVNGFDGSLERLEDLEMGYRAFNLGYDVRFIDRIESYHLAHSRYNYDKVMAGVYSKLKFKHSSLQIQLLEPFLTGAICLHEYEYLVNLQHEKEMKCNCHKGGDCERILYFTNNSTNKRK
ncbi:glycosyltransferase family 2 protein [Paenibacillus motobuensis]|uniref:Glycosyltransferase 2-like domain-containing protein n=1 Tax=Paenibacillus motobuensis TaxID=295324 RepID=A0ABN0XXL8_9BACL